MFMDWQFPVVTGSGFFLVMCGHCPVEHSLTDAIHNSFGALWLLIEFSEYKCYNTTNNNHCGRKMQSGKFIIAPNYSLVQ
jgi:hypothetical protein